MMLIEYRCSSDSGELCDHTIPIKLKRTNSTQAAGHLFLCRRMWVYISPSIVGKEFLN